MSEERNQYAVVPFDTFERYLGPRYENIPGVEYILENGTLLYFMEEAPGVYESADHTVTGEPAAPKLFVPVFCDHWPAGGEPAQGAGVCAGQRPGASGK